MNAFQYTFFSQLNVPDTVERPQTKNFSLVPRKLLRFNYQLIRITLDQSGFKNFPKCSFEQEFLPFLIKDEIVHAR